MDSFKVLVLAGGQSSRMGSPKHLLPVPSTHQPLYQHIIRVIHVAFPEMHTVYISIADKSPLDDVLRQEAISISTETGARRIGIKLISDETTQDVGPAAGLLAAHQYDPNTFWLVVACDFPLLDPEALRQLVEAYKTPVTCFVNREGFSEPLLAMWSQQALQRLRENVRGGRSGPNYTVKQLDGKLIVPLKDDWILNTNTPEEWSTAKSRIKQPQLLGGV